MRLRQQLSKVLVASTSAIFIGACANRVDEHFYLVPSRAVDAVPAVEMRPIAVVAVAIPAVIDRPQLVVRTGEHEVAVMESRRWAEPLSDGLTRAVVDELRINRLPAYDAEALHARKDALTVEIRVAELLSGPSAEARLKATWTVRDRPHSCVETGNFDAQVSAASGFEAVPDAYADAMRSLARAIVPTLRLADTECTKSNL